MRATLARRAPGLRITAAESDLANALRAHPDARIVLCGSDAVAVGAAQALRALHPAGREALYVGGLGVPTLSSRDTISELRRGDVLRVVVAVRLRDLAGAAVDLPTTLALGQPGRDVTLEPHLLTPGSRKLSDEARDFAADRRPPWRTCAARWPRADTS